MSSRTVCVAGKFCEDWGDWAGAALILHFSGEEGVLAGGGSVVGDLDLFLEGGDLESLRGLKLRVRMVLS